MLRRLLSPYGLSLCPSFGLWELTLSSGGSGVTVAVGVLRKNIYTPRGVYRPRTPAHSNVIHIRTLIPPPMIFGLGPMISG